MIKVETCKKVAAGIVAQAAGYAISRFDSQCHDDIKAITMQSICSNAIIFAVNEPKARRMFGEFEKISMQVDVFDEVYSNGAAFICCFEKKVFGYSKSESAKQLLKAYQSDVSELTDCRLIMNTAITWSREILAEIAIAQGIDFNTAQTIAYEFCIVDVNRIEYAAQEYVKAILHQFEPPERIQ